VTLYLVRARVLNGCATEYKDVLQVLFMAERKEMVAVIACCVHSDRTAVLSGSILLHGAACIFVLRKVSLLFSQGMYIRALFLINPVET
jgi:hypothetical protein